jgi:DNA-binding transcriptional ArsR family regulator
MVERSRGTLDLTYAALADPTRRSILTHLRQGEARVTDVAKRLPVSLSAASKHITVLENAGLIHREIRGRDHFLSAQPGPLAEAERWIAEYSAFWQARADALVEHVSRRRAAKRGAR